MFGWLRWRKRRDKREIFRFHDGSIARGVDPIRVLRDLAGHPEFLLDRHPDMMLSGDLDATDITLEAVREVFGIDAWHLDEAGRERGLTDGEVIDVLWKFGQYIDTVKKNGAGPPTWQLATAPPVSDRLEEAESTSVESAFGSTLSGPRLDAQPQFSAALQAASLGS